MLRASPPIAMKPKKPSLARWLLPLAVGLAARGGFGADADDAPTATPRHVKEGSPYVSEAVELRFGHDAPAVFTTNYERGEIAPAVIVLVRQLAPGSAIVFGVSSQGSGMATLQAFLFERAPGGGTRITDRIDMNVHRGHGGMVWAGGRLWFLHPLTSNISSTETREQKEHLAGDYSKSGGDDGDPFITTMYGRLGYGAMARVKFAKQVSDGAVFISDLVFGYRPPPDAKQIATMKMAEIPIVKGCFDLSAF